MALLGSGEWGDKAGLFHSLVLEICQEDNLTQRRKDAKKNQVFRTEDAKIFGLNCGFALAILTLLGNESALGDKGSGKELILVLSSAPLPLCLIAN
jgi:hypothetical protein